MNISKVHCPRTRFCYPLAQRVLSALLAILLILSTSLVTFAQGPAPELRDVAVDHTKFPLPPQTDTYLAHITLNYVDDEGDIVALTVTTTLPDGTQQTQRFDAVSALGIVGQSGSATYQVDFHATNQLGTYTYTLQLIDSKGNTSKEQLITITLYDSNEQPSEDAPLAITKISPQRGQPGDLITVTGQGFDAKDPGANGVNIGGIPATVIKATATQLTVRLPADAIGGSVIVANRNGVTTARDPFTVIPMLTIVSTGQNRLAPHQQLQVSAKVSGILNPEIIWSVNQVAGGTAATGTIDANGLYMAPAVVPAEGTITIGASVVGNEALNATQSMVIAAPLPLVGSGLIPAATGGTLQGKDGLITLQIPPDALEKDLAVKSFQAELLPSREGLAGIPNDMLPLMRILLQQDGSQTLVSDATLQMLLPLRGTLDDQYGVLRQEGDRFELTEMATLISDDGMSLQAALRELRDDLTELIVVRWGEPTPPPADLEPPVVTTVTIPESLQKDGPEGRTLVEEGLTLPILIEGENFWPGFTVIEPVNPAYAGHFLFGTAVVSADLSQVGVTVRIRPIETLQLGDELPIAFSVKRLEATGTVAGHADSDPNDFVISGLPELIARADSGNNLYTVDQQALLQVDTSYIADLENGTVPPALRNELTSHGIHLPSNANNLLEGTDPLWFVIDGNFERYAILHEGEYLTIYKNRRIDAMVQQSGRYSTIEVEAGATLGIGRAVSNVTIARTLGTPNTLQWNLSTVQAFEAKFGRLYWVTDAQRQNNAIRFFQPENEPVLLDVTGPVRINGTIYLGGMRGGENPLRGDARFDDPTGPGTLRIGGLAGGTISGGLGGDGGQTQDDSTQDGKSAGESRTDTTLGYDLGLGRGHGGVEQTAEDENRGGSRFDVVTKEHFIKDLINVIQGFVSLAKESPTGLIKVWDGTKGLAAARAFMPTIAATVSGQIVAGSGGHGGTRADIDPDLSSDSALLSGSGGGGGSGGGSSSYEETLAFLTLSAVKELGGGGGGGGGAAGALRITSATSVEIGEQGMIDAAGGRGGFGEPHRWLGSPGGGGGGGTGGVIKLQAPKLVNRGTIDLSGGIRGGAFVGQDGSPAPSVPSARVQMLPGKQRGGFVYYTSNPTVNIAWPTGRLQGTTTLPVSQILGIGPLTFWRTQRRDGLLVVGADRRVFAMTPPQYGTGNTQISPIGVNARLPIQLDGLTITDIAQSPKRPYHIYVSGYHGTAANPNQDLAQSEVHELTHDGTYRKQIYAASTARIYGDAYIGHIKEIDFLSDGRLAALMATMPAPVQNGVHAIDIANGTSTLLMPWQGPHYSALRSMSVMRSDADQLLLSFHPDAGAELQRYDLFGQRMTQIALVAETVGSPGEPGRMRMDGALPGSTAPATQYDGFDLAGLPYPVQFDLDTTARFPTIASSTAPANNALGMENLVVGFNVFIPPEERDRATLYGQGGEVGQSITVWQNGRQLGGTPPAIDGTGEFQQLVPLELGFNTFRVETNNSGTAPELLHHHLLSLRTYLPSSPPTIGLPDRDAEHQLWLPLVQR